MSCLALWQLDKASARSDVGGLEGSSPHWRPVRLTKITMGFLHSVGSWARGISYAGDGAGSFDQLPPLRRWASEGYEGVPRASSRGHIKSLGSCVFVRYGYGVILLLFIRFYGGLRRRQGRSNRYAGDSTHGFHLPGKYPIPRYPLFARESIPSQLCTK